MLVSSIRPFLVICFFIPLTSFGIGTELEPRKCDVLLNQSDSDLFKNEILANADTGRSKLLRDYPVKNQRSYGCCWISSTLGKFERETEKKIGQVVPLSENFLILRSLQFRIREGLYFGADIFQGGWAETSEWMSRVVGLMPEAAWTPNVDLRDPYVGQEILAYLNLQILLYQKELSHLKAEGKSLVEAVELTEKTKIRLYKYLSKRVGVPPYSFEVAGIRTTAPKFSKKVLGSKSKYTFTELNPVEPRVAPEDVFSADILDSKLGLMSQFPGSKKVIPTFLKDADEVNENMIYFRSKREKYSSKKMKLKKIHSEVIAAIHSGETVQIAVRMVKEFYDSKTGVMSITANGKTLAEAKKTKFRGAHAMLITGVYRDVKNNLLGYRIQNSWGDKTGMIGYYYMDRDYFDTYVLSVGIPKKN